ncbi:MAG: hypothetical protein ACO3QC_02825 [Phycisphaerales bacterium]
MRKNTLNNSITTLALGLTFGLGMAIGQTAAAQELVKSDEHRIAQDSQAYFLMSPANGKLSFQAAGAATDLVVIRLADGTVFATATIEQLLKGITGDHKLPEEPKPEGEGAKPGSKEASAGAESVDSSDQQSPDVADGVITEESDTSASGNEAKLLEAIIPVGDWSAIEAKPVLGTNNPDVAWKSLAGPVEILRAEFTFASIPWAFHGGSVSIYRGASELDRDMILLY